MVGMEIEIEREREQEGERNNKGKEMKIHKSSSQLAQEESVRELGSWEKVELVPILGYIRTSSPSSLFFPPLPPPSSF